MKKLLILLVLLFSSCASFHLSTLNHDTVLVVSSDTQVDTLNEFQFRNKLRNDFNFRYDFAQYALTQPRSFDWNNRILGNRYNFYSPYGFGYNYYWNRDQMWNDWVWGYTGWNSWGSPHRWSPFGYDRWGYGIHYGWNNHGWRYNNWYNGPWHNQSYNAIWNRSRGTNIVHHSGRRGSSNIQNKVVTNNTIRTRVVINKPRVIKNKPRVVINYKPRINNPTPRITPIPRQRVNTPTRARSIPNNNTRSSSNPPTRGNSKRNN